MSDLTHLDSRAISSLSSRGAPQDFRLVEAKIDALITIAARMQQWDLLERAVDAKIEDQAEFVRWWDDNVRHPGRPAENNAGSGLITRHDAEQHGISQQQVARWRKQLADDVRYRAQQILAAYRKAGLTPAENHRAEGSGENEWFTPARYVEAARRVLGTIDLDPATHPAAQQTIQASQFYTRADDGLSLAWHGRVWLNPPYAQPLISQFVEKLVTDYASGDVTEAVMLTHNYTDTAWFHLAEATAALLCFTKGRIRFIDLDGEECSPTQGQTFFYYGTRKKEFRAAFGSFGFVR